MQTENQRLLDFVKMMYAKIEEFGFQEDDELEFDKIEILTDDGEYPSLCLINKSLEERMKDEN